MSDREKLIELLGGDVCPASCCEECDYECSEDACIRYMKESMADHLISNGVTVGVEAKPLKQYLTQIDEYAGLKLKFLVFKADTGERIENCFVLRPDKDHAAVEALRAYAEATDNKTLADDIYNWVGNGVTVKKWIPVSERLPSFEDAIQPTVYDDPAVLAVFKFDDRPRIWCIDVIRRNPEKFTHWMPLPSLPKECE